MRKIIFMMIISCIVVFTLVSCVNTTDMNVQIDGVTSNTLVGKDSLVKIGNGLYYDSVTNIVYWWNGAFEGGDYVTMPSPYYASNGLPYKYDPGTNTLKELNSHAK